jgi:hypothetical protein
MEYANKIWQKRSSRLDWIDMIGNEYRGYVLPTEPIKRDGLTWMRRTLDVWRDVVDEAIQRDPAIR